MGSIAPRNQHKDKQVLTVWKNQDTGAALLVISLGRRTLTYEVRYYEPEQVTELDGLLERVRAAGSTAAVDTNGGRLIADVRDKHEAYDTARRTMRERMEGDR